MKSLRFLVLLLALINAVLYCCLQPLWEGFDEPFHYAYVQSLSTRHQLPQLGHSYVSREVFRSLQLTPLSLILQRSIPGAIAFEDWFRLPAERRLDRKAALQVNRSADQFAASDLLNYEAQQTPLSYLALAPLDTYLRSTALPARILLLRLAIAAASTLLVVFGVYQLATLLGLNAVFAALIAAVLFDTQIVAAAMYHVANYWLAIAALTWFAVLTVELTGGRQADRTAYWLAVITAVGLLSKAYFLAFVPIFVFAVGYATIRGRLSRVNAGHSLALLAVLAAPWYLRKFFIFGTLAGMQEDAKGVQHADLAFAFHHIRWLKTFIESARWSLWTGNESHLAFSQVTLNLQLCLFAAGALLYLVQVWKSYVREWALLTIAVTFVAALMYDLCVTWTDTHGDQQAFGPYYSRCIFIPLLLLLFLGLQRSGLPGRILSLAIAALSAWIALLTYLVKLVPYYGSLIGKGTLAATWHWWLGSSHQILSQTVLDPVNAVYTLLALYCVLLLIVHWLIVQDCCTLNSEIDAFTLP